LGRFKVIIMSNGQSYDFGVLKNIADTATSQDTS